MRTYLILANGSTTTLDTFRTGLANLGTFGVAMLADNQMPANRGSLNQLIPTTFTALEQVPGRLYTFLLGPVGGPIQVVKGWYKDGVWNWDKRGGGSAVQAPTLVTRRRHEVPENERGRL